MHCNIKTLALVAIDKFGYLAVVLASTVYSVVWMVIMAPRVRSLAAAPRDAWVVRATAS